MAMSRGTRLGPYKILSTIDAVARGRVYRARLLAWEVPTIRLKCEMSEEKAQ